MRLMTWLGPVLALALAAMPAGAADPIKAAATGAVKNFTVSEPPKPTPAVTFKAADGSETSLDAFKGKVVLVNFWATWCLPCREEMPSLAKLQKDVGGADFTVLALSQDRLAPEKVQTFLKDNGAADLQPYQDQTMKSGRAFGALGLPTTVLIDRQGREIGRLVGPAAWDSPEAVALIKTALAH